MRGNPRLKRILVGTDFSQAADRAIRRAALLASEHGAELTLLHAATPVPKTLLRKLGIRAARADNETELRRQLGSALQHTRRGRLSATTRQVSGTPARALLAEAARGKADLIVVGEGRHSLGHAFIGTTAERIIERSTCTVLIVKQHAGHPYRTALACLALAPPSAKLLAQASMIAGSAELRALHVYEPLFERKLKSHDMPRHIIADHHSAERRKARAELIRFLEEHRPPMGKKVRPVLRAGYPSDAIRRSVVANRTELVCVGKHRSALEDLLVGSVAKRVMRSVPADVLVVAP